MTHQRADSSYPKAFLPIKEEEPLKDSINPMVFSPPHPLASRLGIRGAFEIAKTLGTTTDCLGFVMKIS